MDFCGGFSLPTMQCFLQQWKKNCLCLIGKLILISLCFWHPMLLHWSQWRERYACQIYQQLWHQQTDFIMHSVFSNGYSRCKVMNMGPKRFYEDFMKNIPGLMTSCRGFKKTDIAEYHWGRWWGKLFFLLIE